MGRILHKFLQKILKPKYFLMLSQTVKTYSILAMLMFCLGFLYCLVFIAVPDTTQGFYAYIMYVHVPASWAALSVYCVLALVNAYGLVTRFPQAFILAKALATIGFTYCLISLLTGSLWGKPTWGTFWVWDARLTSMLILFLFYCIYLYLSQSYTVKKLVPSAFVAVIGCVNIPIIKGSVDWWFTLHQPASLKIIERVNHFDKEFLLPLLFMVGFFVAYTCFLTSLRIIVLSQKLKEKK